jgi:hypothetical protein
MRVNKKEQARLARAAEKAAAIQARADEWQASVNEHFGFLESIYGFRVTQVDASSVWNNRVTYQTATTGVYVDSNAEFGRVEVSLVRLLDGELPLYPIFVRRDTVLHEFPLDWLLMVRARHLLSELRAAKGLNDEQVEKSLKLLAGAVNDYAADVLRGDFSIFAALEALVKQNAQAIHRRDQESQSLPRELQWRFVTITERTDAFSQEYLTDEFADLCRQLTMALGQKDPSPLAQSKATTWACSIIYTLGTVNLLFDASQTPHISVSLLEDYFDLSLRTMRAKSKLISDLLGLYPLAPEWTLMSMSDR